MVDDGNNLVHTQKRASDFTARVEKKPRMFTVHNPNVWSAPLTHFNKISYPRHVFRYRYLSRSIYIPSSQHNIIEIQCYKNTKTEPNFLPKTETKINIIITLVSTNLLNLFGAEFCFFIFLR